MTLNHNNSLNILTDLFRFLFPLVLITLLLPSGAAAQTTLCSPEPTDMNITYGSVISCAIDIVGDTDTFRFSGQTGEKVYILASTTGGDGEACIDVFDPTGEKLTFGSCSDFTLTTRIDPTLSSSGTYTVLVSDFRHTRTLQYNLSIECLLQCPPPPPPDSVTYYMPHLALGEGWQTTLTYINYSPETVICETTLYSDTGGPLSVPLDGSSASSRSDTLAPGGTLHVESAADLNAPVVSGWARAVCSAPIKASLLFRFYQQGQPVSEAGVNAMTAPATKFVTFAERLTGVAYANPSLQTAEVTFRVISSTGSILANKSLPLQPGEHGAANLGPFLGLEDFTGSLQIVSTVPILSLSLNFEAAPVFSSLPPGELDGSTPLR